MAGTIYKKLTKYLGRPPRVGDTVVGVHQTTIFISEGEDLTEEGLIYGVQKFVSIRVVEVTKDNPPQANVHVEDFKAETHG